MPIEFPDTKFADPESGLIAVGGDLSPSTLLSAYKKGIFPWPVCNEFLTWFAPKERAILYLDNLHISRSTRKALHKTTFTTSIDQAFNQVITACSEIINRGDQDGTWITPDIITAYTELHKLGYAHSVECWDGQELVGGLYGVSIQGFFAGESMFYRKSYASKIAFCHLTQHLAEQGVTWIDCQVTTPLFSSFGCTEISRTKFTQLLNEALKKPPIQW